jgi:hypothetical protein
MGKPRGESSTEDRACGSAGKMFRLTWDLGQGEGLGRMREVLGGVRVAWSARCTGVSSRCGWVCCIEGEEI